MLRRIEDEPRCWLLRLAKWELSRGRIPHLFSRFRNDRYVAHVYVIRMTDEEYKLVVEFVEGKAKPEAAELHGLDSVYKRDGSA